MRNKFLNNQKLKLYHGSESYDITEFKTPAFFINKLEVAQYFQEKNGGAIYEVTLDVKKPFMLNYPNSYEKVFSLLDSLKIPYSLDREKMEAGKPFFLCPEINKHNSKYKGDNINDFVYIPQVVLALKKQNYDGVVIADKWTNYTHEIWIAFDSKKINILHNKPPQTKPQI